MSDTVKKWHEMQAEGENNDDTCCTRAVKIHILTRILMMVRYRRYDISCIRQ